MYSQLRKNQKNTKAAKKKIAQTGANNEAITGNSNDPQEIVAGIISSSRRTEIITPQ